LSNSDFQIGRGFGKYRQIADNRPGEGPLAAQVSPGSVARQYHTVNGQTTVSLQQWSEIKFVIPKAVKDKDWRIRVFDPKGTLLWTMLTPLSELSSPDHRTFRASCNAAPEAIERLVLEARDYQWVTIKNLHIPPSDWVIHP
jgi:hypothetical protein